MIRDLFTGFKLLALAVFWTTIVGVWAVLAVLLLNGSIT